MAGDFSHVINCPPTPVDRAEEEKMQCAAANVDAVSNIARIADELGFKVLHFSTDYVFDRRTPAALTASDSLRALSVYGVTKRKGRDSTSRPRSREHDHTHRLALRPPTAIISCEQSSPKGARVLPSGW